MTARIDGTDYLLDGDAEYVEGRCVITWRFVDAVPDCPNCYWPFKPRVFGLPNGDRALLCGTCLHPFQVVGD